MQKEYFVVALCFNIKITYTYMHIYANSTSRKTHSREMILLGRQNAK